jgi:hypothetical protein
VYNLWNSEGEIIDNLDRYNYLKNDVIRKCGCGVKTIGSDLSMKALLPKGIIIPAEEMDFHTRRNVTGRKEKS